MTTIATPTTDHMTTSHTHYRSRDYYTHPLQIMHARGVYHTQISSHHTPSSSSLRSNSLSRDGAGHLSSLLRTNSPLTTLNLSHNRIEDDGLVHISEALTINYTLTR